MRVLCKGWRHIDKNHMLINRDISLTHDAAEWPRNRDEIYLDLDGNDVVISSGVENLQMKGNFAIYVRLSKKEIINLARIALAREPFGEVIAALSGNK